MSMHRRRLTGLCAASAALAAFPVRGSERRRVGFLSQGAPSEKIYGKFIARMQSFGWAASRNVEYRYEWADEPWLPERAATLAAWRPDVVVASGDLALRSARLGIPDVPIVMAPSNNPVGLGLVTSLRRPGGRITGTAWTQDADISGKYVELAVDLLPGLKRLGAVIDPGYPGIDRYRPPFDAAARRLGITAPYFDVRSRVQIDEVFEAMRVGRMQAAFVFGSVISYRHAEAFAEAARATHLPTIHIFRHAAEAGAPVSYGPSWPDLVIKGADFVDKILRGANPADLPVEQPTTYELIVNLRAAAAIGLKVPQTMLTRADEVIE